MFLLSLALAIDFDQTTINQHYVPRFYMKNFSEVKNEKTTKKNNCQNRDKV